MEACRNCLFSEQEKEKMQKSIEDYVNSLSPENKAGEGLFEERLKLCADCPDQREGLCRICGCFVMARAAKKQAYCPAVERRW